MICSIFFSNCAISSTYSLTSCLGSVEFFFDKYGIISFWGFYHHIRNKDDIENIVGDINENDIAHLWKAYYHIKMDPRKMWLQHQLLKVINEIQIIYNF